MSTTGVVYPGSSTTAAGAVGCETVNWFAVDKIKLDDALRATRSDMAAGAHTKRATAYNFGFAIPSTATINGIYVTIERSTGDTSDIYDRSVQLCTSGFVFAGDNKAKTGDKWPQWDGQASYGGSTDLWGLTLTPTDVNDSGFGVGITVDNKGTGVGSARIDYIRMTVAYAVSADITIEDAKDIVVAVQEATLATGANVDSLLTNINIAVETPIITGGSGSIIPDTNISVAVPVPTLQTGAAIASLLTNIDILVPIPSIDIVLPGTVDVVTTDIGIGVPSPAIGTGAILSLGISNIAVTSFIPVISCGKSVFPDTIAVSFETVLPIIRTGVNLNIPRTNITIQAQTIPWGAVIGIPVTNISVGKLNPKYIGIILPPEYPKIESKTGYWEAVSISPTREIRHAD